MKFLLNMNIPRNLGIKLMQNGCEYRHVGDIGMFSSCFCVLVVKYNLK